MRVAFYKGRERLFNRAASWWLCGPYSHVELILGADINGLSICASSSMIDGGVRIKHMRLDPEHWDFIEIDGDAAAALARAWTWLAEHEGEAYDFLGLAGFVARVLGDDKRRSTCSEAVAAMLGMPDSWRFDPCSLYAALSRPCGHEDQILGSGT